MENKILLQIWDEEYLMFNIIIPKNKEKEVEDTVRRLHDEFFDEDDQEKYNLIQSEYESYYDYISRSWLEKQEYIVKIELQEMDING